MSIRLAPRDAFAKHGAADCKIDCQAAPVQREQSAMIPWINDYIASHRRALESIDAAILSRMIDTLREAWREDRQIFACGNGGSAANASHFVTDLGKGSSDAI